MEYRREDPQFQAYAHITIKNQDGTTEEISKALVDVPGEIMDQLQQLVGDANARVSYSVELSGPKDFGNGASARVSISIACNQDLQTVHQAATLVEQMTRHYAKGARQEAEKDYQEILAAKQRQQFGG